MTEEQQRLYAALVVAVASSPGLLADATRADEVAAELAERYAGADERVQREIDSALAAVEEGLAPGAFATMETRLRLHHLRTRLADDRPAGSGLAPSPADAVRSAVALANAPFCHDSWRWDVDLTVAWTRTLRVAA